MADLKRRVRIRLMHDGVQPGPALTETLRFGLQDAKGGIDPGVVAEGSVRYFDLVLEVKNGADGTPVFTGACAQGPASGRFLYLSWKREEEAAAPYGWRIKIPLAGIGWAEIEAASRPGCGLVADVRGRRPHLREPVAWRVEMLT